MTMRKQGNGAKPQVEVLEDRMLLSVASAPFEARFIPENNPNNPPTFAWNLGSPSQGGAVLDNPGGLPAAVPAAADGQQVFLTLNGILGESQNSLHLDAVARDPRVVVSDRLAAAEEPIHERRLPDVLPADDGDPRHGHGRSSGARTAITSSAAATVAFTSSSPVSSTVASEGGTNGFTAASL